MTDFSMHKKLDNYLAKSPSSFHTPGHKGQAKASPLFDISIKYDLTELKETGSLFDGEGLTAQAEKAVSRLFKTKATFLSAGGCTLPIQAMLRLALPSGGKILCSRMLHRSAVNAMALLGIEAHWIFPDKSAGRGFSGRANPDEIKDALINDKSIRAVYITSPDYFGTISDINTISEICSAHKIPLLVDNAHGSHLYFLEEKLHPMQNGASMCADSAHKTLPVFTGGAWLHVNDAQYLANAREAMSLFASTSPSYLTLLSLDLCREWLEKEGVSEFKKLREKVAELRKLMLSLGFSFPKGITDPLRLAAAVPAFDKTGAEAAEQLPKNMQKSGIRLAEYLRENGIEPEFADENRIILIPSPLNTDEDFFKLSKALSNIKSNHTGINGNEDEETYSSNEDEIHLPKTIMPLRNALLSPSELLETSMALGRVAAQTACLCPPGIPVAVPGELIDEKTFERLIKADIKNIKVVK